MPAFETQGDVREYVSENEDEAVRVKAIHPLFGHLGTIWFYQDEEGDLVTVRSQESTPATAAMEPQEVDLGNTDETELPPGERDVIALSEVPTVGDSSDSTGSVSPSFETEGHIREYVEDNPDQVVVKPESPGDVIFYADESGEMKIWLTGEDDHVEPMGDSQRLHGTEQIETKPREEETRLPLEA